MLPLILMPTGLPCGLIHLDSSNVTESLRLLGGHVLMVWLNVAHMMLFNLRDFLWIIAHILSYVYLYNGKEGKYILICKLEHKLKHSPWICPHKFALNIARPFGLFLWNLKHCNSCWARKHQAKAKPAIVCVLKTQLAALLTCHWYIYYLLI